MENITCIRDENIRICEAELWGISQTLKHNEMEKNLDFKEYQ